MAAQRLESGSLDALLKVPVFGQNLYFGGGADVFDLSQLSSVDTLQTGDVETLLASGVFGAHAMLGAELRLSLSKRRNINAQRVRAAALS